MADSRGNKNDVTFLEFIPLCSHEILCAAGVSAAEHFIELVAVELEVLVAAADILMSIYKVRIHFQFLI